MGIDMEHITLEIGLELSTSEWPIERLSSILLIVSSQAATFSMILSSGSQLCA
jgi:hypothetical protein